MTYDRAMIDYIAHGTSDMEAVISTTLTHAPLPVRYLTNELPRSVSKLDMAARERFIAILEAVAARSTTSDVERGHLQLVVSQWLPSVDRLRTAIEIFS